ncbi:MAG: YqeG family HAD IIIA-type phosphatase [Clostridiales bacterium]|nr:YqeG family HAD IIIA-type phosphatase [Clostridiales bacterium]
MFFKPTYVFNSVGEISIKFLKKRGIKALILDLDNTLTTHNNPVPPERSLNWLDKMKEAGMKLIIVSNNSTERVTPFANQLGLDFVPRGCKPLTFDITNAMKRLGSSHRETCVVGDQIFTDIMGANLKGVRSAFVFPIEPETSLPFRFKRKIETLFLPKR